MRPDIVERLAEDIESAREVEITRNRYGYEIDGQRYKRVTTMLGGVPKPWLGQWAAKMVAEYAVDTWTDLPDAPDNWTALRRDLAIKQLKGVPWAKRDKAADRGTAIHESLDAIAKGEPIPETLTDEERACVAEVRKFHLRRGSRALASELTVYNSTYGYAGTLDLWEHAKDGASWVLDYKTSAAVYAEHAIQQVAYQRCEWAIVGKVATGKEKWIGKVLPWGPDMAERLGIVHVTETDVVLHPINENVVERLWGVFRAAIKIKTFQLDTDSYAGRKARVSIYEATTGGHDVTD